MILRKDLRYVVLDFETTGTDKKHDEIIQIGITEYDAEGDILQNFRSYIKPAYTDKLHDMIDMITGISYEQLISAPTWDEIKPIVQTYFDGTTVVIGHSVGFDLAFLHRYAINSYYTSIDTLPLSQSLSPYLSSYALEIIAGHLLPKDTLPKEGFHDAGVDSKITGEVFFALIKKLAVLLHEFPYLREISKRTSDGLSQCLVFPEERYLLKEIPTFAVSTQNDTYSSPANDIIPAGTFYIGDTYLNDILPYTVNTGYISSFSQHAKVLLAQKRLAQNGLLYALHEQSFFDTTTLHHFFTKKSFVEREWLCAIKYFLHVLEKHKSYHTVNQYDYLFMRATEIQKTQYTRKRLYTHSDIFSAVASLTLPTDQHIVLYDKERLFDSWKKRRYSAMDLYGFTDQLEAIVYKYTLYQKELTLITNLLNSRYIFIALFTSDANLYCKDVQAESIRIDDFFSSLYFYKSQKIWDKIQQILVDIHKEVDDNDMILLEKNIKRYDDILHSVFIIAQKRSNYAERCTIQPVDTFVSRDDINQLFQGYTVTYLSVFDKALPPLPISGSQIQSKKIVKWKDITVGATPKLCIIAPSKAAAQQLILSLHKSKVYQDCFLAAEHITGGSGKIIQQAIGKDSYILIGGYVFCTQCLAHGLPFDSICALDIIDNNTVNPFTDISYYGATKKL